MNVRQLMCFGFAAVISLASTSVTNAGPATPVGSGVVDSDDDQRRRQGQRRGGRIDDEDSDSDSDSDSDRDRDRRGRVDRNRFPFPERDRNGTSRSPRGRRGSNVDATAFDNGDADGYEKGLEDARDGRDFDPTRHRWYRSADRGYEAQHGSRTRYADAYRDGFKDGYEAGYRDGSRNGNGNGRNGRWPGRLPWPF